MPRRKKNPIPTGVHPYIITDPYTGEIIFAHYLECYSPNYFVEHFVPSEFVKKRGGVIRSIKTKNNHVVRLGFWNHVDDRHLHYCLVEILHPIDPKYKCRLRDTLIQLGLWDELVKKRGLLEDSFLIGYRKHKEIDRILKHVHQTLEKERIRVVTPVTIPYAPIGLVRVV